MNQAKPPPLAKIAGTNKFIEVDPRGDANPSCKRCHGTGIMGTKLHPNGKCEGLVCSCVVRKMKERLAEGGEANSSGNA